jgi:hypothetical protein
LPPEPRGNVLATLRRYGPGFLYDSNIPRHARRSLDKILGCRSGEYGSSVFDCKACSSKRILYSPCTDRHCPNCGWLKRKKWLDTVQSWELDTKYYHIVFTAPHELTEFFENNSVDCYNLFFEIAIRVLMQVCAKQFGCKPGVLITLHTWGQRMLMHVHVHCMMTAGGIGLKTGEWVDIPQDSPALNPQELAALFKKKFVRSLKFYKKHGKFDLSHLLEDESFDDWLAPIAAKNWIADAQITPDCLATKEQCSVYLSEYVQGTAISDTRMVEDDEENVTISQWDYREEVHTKEKMSGDEFVRRFLKHIVPPEVRRMRYAGLFSGRDRTAMVEKARSAIADYKRAKREIEDPDAARNTKTLLQESLSEAEHQIRDNQAPRTEALKALSKPKCKQCGQREMEFTEYRSPWHTKNDIKEIYHWIGYFAVIYTTMDDKVHQAMLKISRQFRIPQMTIMDWWYTSQEFASISELEIGETITCSQLECSCTRVSSFELSMVQLPLPEN